MMETRLSGFGKVLQEVMKLPEDEQEMLVDIIRRRATERWRDDLAKHVLKVKEDIRAGKYTAQTAEEVIKDLENSLNDPEMT